MQTLSIKYRPKCFAELVEQDVIVSVLSKQIETKTFKNAYLFAGPSGCGKTTTARIMANEINNGDGEPFEIDAASNNGVDNIRQLIVDAQQTAIDAEYKVYIIDECHMLTTAAWNAALKLIEEPPANAIFIFCTTNPNKIPETIMSRVQRFDFRRIPINSITDRLEFILNEEVIATYKRDALQRIAIMSNGFMREAISLLDKCLSYSNDISLENVEKVLGLVSYEQILNLFNSIYCKNSEEAISLLENIKIQNSNQLVILDNLMQFVIDCAKLQKTNNPKLTAIPSIYIDKIKTYTEDMMIFVDRIFKFRQLVNELDIDTLLNVLVLELCWR